MSQRLIVLGAGGNAYDVMDIVEALNSIRPTWELRGLLDDRHPPGHEIAGCRVLGPLAQATEFPDCLFINAIRNPTTFRITADILASTRLEPHRFATLVHPGACVSSRATVGRGVYVNVGASVAGNVTLGDHVSLGPLCIVGHDTVVGACSILAPGAVVSGGVRLGDRCYVGTGATIRQQVCVGAASMIGMGAVVVHDVAPGTTVIGNPARIMHARSTLPCDRAPESAHGDVAVR